jgi:hypothetical protein
MEDDLFNVLLSLDCKYFIGNFSCMSSGKLAYNFLFFAVFISSFGIRVILAS